MKQKFILLAILTLIFTFISCSKDLEKAQLRNKKLTEERNKALVELAELRITKKFYEKEIKRLQEQIKKLEENYNKTSKERDKLLTSSITNEAKLKMLNDRLKFLEKEIKALEKRKIALQKRNLKLLHQGDKKLQNTQKALAKSKAQMNKLKLQLALAKAKRMRIVEDAQRRNTTANTQSIDVKIKEIKKQILAKIAEIEKLKKEVERLKKEILNQRKSFQRIITALKKEIKKGKIRASINGREIKMTLMDRVMFTSGSTTINRKGKRILKLIGKELKRLRYGLIYVEGHTDSDRVVAWRLKQIYPTNWEFSVIRAVNVVRYLVERTGVNPAKIIAAGRSRYVPRQSNTTYRGKALNRRIEILISPERKILTR